jgi:hypothetical protein
VLWDRAEVTSRLAFLRWADPGFTRFGSAAHRYLLNQPLSQSEVAAIPGGIANRKIPTRETSIHTHICDRFGAGLVPAAGAAYSASMNSYFSVTEASWRSMPQLF